MVATSGADQHGSALILVPTLMLVLMALGSIALDMSLLHASQRSVHRVVSAAADDAASMFDTTELQVSGVLRIDPDAATAVAVASISAASMPGELVGPIEVRVSGEGDTVSVAATVRIDHVMLRAVPGTSDHELIHVEVRGRLNR